MVFSLRPRRQCPFCNSDTHPSFVAKDWNQKSTEQNFKYQKCRQCSLISMTSIPSDLSGFYVGEQYDIPWQSEDFGSRAETQAWKLSLIQPFVSEGKLLEVGPATGEFATVASTLR